MDPAHAERHERVTRRYAGPSVRKDEQSPFRYASRPRFALEDTDTHLPGELSDG
jgi:hypothetical protein